VSQFSYLDENTTAAVYGPNPTPPPALINTTCGAQCHFQSQFQSVNYTTRNVGGGADVDLGPVRLTWEHKYSSFNDRLTSPTGTFTGPFTPENEGISVVNPPGFGPAPQDIPAIKCDDFSLHQLPTSNMLRELHEQCEVEVRVLACQTTALPDQARPGLSDAVRRALPEAAARVAARYFHAGHGIS
jgi:hypothetical protein